MKEEMNLESFYAQVSHPEEAIQMMNDEAVVALGTALWP